MRNETFIYFFILATFHPDIPKGLKTDINLQQTEKNCIFDIVNQHH